VIVTHIDDDMHKHIHNLGCDMVAICTSRVIFLGYFGDFVMIV